MTQTRGKRRTALVLGAGGLVGGAWETGVLYGLADAGVDAASADLIIGSSAGAVVAARLAAGKSSIAELYEGELDGSAPAEPPARLGALTILRYAVAVLTSRTPEEYGRKLGRLALGAATVDEAARRATVGRRLDPVTRWPDRPLLISSVDALNGELAAYDADSGVPLVDAVTASCAIPGLWPPATLDGRRRIDGGVHSTANAHLAAGYERVVVIAPNASGNNVVLSPARQGAALAAAGARVEVITPDRASKQALGRNSLDPSHRAPAARAGRAQAAAHAPAVAALWAQ
ncbi:MULTISPECIES: patatin-like phospholipase family protein [Streptomyces]|uniref:Patatin-like phospholipase family protein n=1 Tax=Streptomyces solicathayae TaxID=3081768 RepID=A0ABZ0M2B9_9ACTN|nr:patatin-like phospholipase family protein [Streptomyces sp. HUAS YS2]WOX25655.1 patatin-like phospholipase family protein [Streptomyces sp. HUAS YS2]